jgi:hypothetical protein
MPSFRDFWKWVLEAFTPSYQDEIDAYLAQSTSIYDLEQRMRQLEKRGML